ncbi:hypothetical protein LTS10_008189 [Elasticomyces elasticus]|nr:hypothetical protein LTS10_008189 [Elasticomyces elasticus]
MNTKRSSSEGSGTEPTSKRFKPDYLDTITILADITETPFLVHKDFLCQKSDFFSAACSKAWAEGRQGVIKLPTMTPGTVKLLDILDWADAENRPHKKGRTFQLFRLYAAADAFLDVALKNATMDALRDLKAMDHCKMSTESLNYVWESTASGACLRKFLLGWIAATAPPGLWRKVATDISHELMTDVCVHMMEHRVLEQSVEAPWAKDWCDYHEHGEGENRCV